MNRSFELTWPRLLQLPPPRPMVVYFDMNHWIGLAKANTGHPDGQRYRDALEACRMWKNRGQTIFVLSSQTYMEMEKIKKGSQRLALTEVMEDLSDFVAMVSRVNVMELELDAVVDPYAEHPSPYGPISLLGDGVFHAFGKKGGARIYRRNEDGTKTALDPSVLLGERTVGDLMKLGNLMLQRGVLRGPADQDEENELKSKGWKPESALRVAEDRAAEARRLADLLFSDEDPQWRQNRLRDGIAARELIIEFQDILPRVLTARGVSWEQLLRYHPASQYFVRCMPSTEVAMELKTTWHRNRDKDWTANDVYDIDALALAVPYCDVVVTEKACHHVLTMAKLGERMHTKLLRSVDELPTVLEQWQPKRPESFS